MGFKANFSSLDNAFETKFNNEEQEYSPTFGSYNTIYDGENGATFYPNVSEDGILSWTNDKNLANPTPRKVRGEDGEDGDDGVSVTSVRQTTTSNVDGGENVITVSLSNGKDFIFVVKNGSKGSKGDVGDKGEKGDKGDTGAQGSQGVQGIQGVKGDTGEPFTIAKVYSSISSMNSGYNTDGVKIGQFVVISTGNVEDEDNAKMFLKGNSNYEYITDLSGAQGMRGEKGERGEQGIQGANGKDGTNGKDGKTAYQYAQEGGFGGSESEFASHIAREIPTKVSQLDNDEGYLKSYTESDPTVPAWAKQQTKPKYTADEVGARPSTWMPTYSDVGAEKSGTADTKVATHNTNGAAHNDIRLLIEGLTTRLNALANSDDKTLDQMKEVVDYIKANRDLIGEITTNKISYSDIVNNLTTNVSSKPLSAAQGVALKALIDAITIPTKVSELTNDAGYLKSYTESDPTVPSWAKASTKPKYTAEEVGAVSSKALADAINVALATAKESGEFDGKDGEDGEDGYTPVKGTDYYTAEDKAELISGLTNKLSLGIASDGLIYLFVDGNPVGTGIPMGNSGDVFGYVDENNNIVLSGNVADGTYSVKYEITDESGAVVETIDIGNLVLDTEEEPEPAEPTNFFVVDGDGYLNPGRASSTGANRTDVTTCLLSNYIEVQNGDIVSVDGMVLTGNLASNSGFYGANKAGVYGGKLESATSYVKDVSFFDNGGQFTINNANVEYIRICGAIPSDVNAVKVTIKRSGEWL